MNLSDDSRGFPVQGRPLLLMFFFSGFCSLAYQIIWMRLAFASFGVNAAVLSVVVSVFMLGLGIGSWWGGRWASRLAHPSGRRALLVYAAVEGITAIGAWAVPRLFHGGASALQGFGEMASGPYLWASAFVLTAILLPWTIAMGATTPLGLQFLKDRFKETRGFSALYLANVAGAGIGVLATAFVLIEILGFSDMLYVAAAINLVLATAAMMWAARLKPTDHPVALDASPSSPPTVPIPLWPAVVLFLTGFVSMAAEMAWFRTFSIFLGTQVYAYSGLLAVYLAATVAGSMLYRRSLVRGREIPPGRLLPFLAMAALVPLALGDQMFHPTAWKVLLSIFPFCFLLGYQTPGVVDRASNGDPRLAGGLYAINTVGGILGPLMASYIGLPLMGEKWTLWVLAALPLGLALVTADERFGLPTRRGVVAISILVLVMGCRFDTYVEYKTAGSKPDYMVKRDATATSVAIGRGMGRELIVNGVGITCLTTATKVMAHLPAVCLPHPPRNALVICFGMGTTFRSLTTWGIPVDAVELAPGVRDCFGFFHSDASEVLSRPGARIIIDDGRRFLARTRNVYDLVTLDPPPPLEAAGDSLLYSKEFYQRIQSRLSEDGILAQWVCEGEDAMISAMENTLKKSFPYVRVFDSPMFWGGKHLLASRHPIQLPDAEEALRRMPEAARRDLLEWCSAKNTDTIRFLFNGHFGNERQEDVEKASTITDDRPFNEYFLLRRYVLPHFIPSRP